MTTRTKSPRIQQDLRLLIDAKLATGWHIESRDPLTLGRIGCKQKIELRQNGVLVSL